MMGYRVFIYQRSSWAGYKWAVQAPNGQVILISRTSYFHLATAARAGKVFADKSGMRYTGLRSRLDFEDRRGM